MIIGRIFALLIAGPIALGPAAGLAQDWPTKPIRVVIPFAAGSVSEAIFRTLSPGIEAKLGQRFVVESKPGADGAIGTGEVVRAAPDGYTLLLGPTAVYAVTPHLFKNLGFDPLAALDPISLLADAPLLAVIGANVPAKSLRELADYVRANPGKFNYGSPGTGSPAHLTGAAFAQETGNSLVYVPYKGTPPMVQALLANDIQIAFPTLTGIIGPIKAGRLKARRPSKPDFRNGWAATGGCSRRLTAPIRASSSASPPSSARRSPVRAYASVSASWAMFP